jgi:hypothetical protein
MTHEEKLTLDRQWRETGYADLGIGFGDLQEQRAYPHATVLSPRPNRGRRPKVRGAIAGMVFALVIEAILGIGGYLFYCAYQFFSTWLGVR